MSRIVRPELSVDTGQRYFLRDIAYTLCFPLRDTYTPPARKTDAIGQTIVQDPVRWKSTWSAPRYQSRNGPSRPVNSTAELQINTMCVSP
jgi:hypothetical protein